MNADTMKYKYTYDSPLGKMIMLGTLTYLTDLFFEDEQYAPTYNSDEYIEQLTGPFEVTVMWLNQYFKGQKPFILPPMQLEGTDFRKQVWSILQTIPYGETTTYGVIGRKIAAAQGKKKCLPKPLEVLWGIIQYLLLFHVIVSSVKMVK